MLYTEWLCWLTFTKAGRAYTKFKRRVFLTAMELQMDGINFRKEKMINQFFKILTFIFLLFVSMHAMAQVSVSSNFSATVLHAGDTVTFSFTFLNANTPQSSTMTNTQLLLQFPIVNVNGLPTYIFPINVNSSGFPFSFVSGPLGDPIAVKVNYGNIPKGTMHTASIVYQAPQYGSENAAPLYALGNLTWNETPGSLNSSSIATFQVAPFLQITLAPVPVFVAPNSFIQYQVQYLNTGGAVARRAYIVVPIPANTYLISVGSGTGNPRPWFSSTAYPLSYVNSNAFIEEHFQPGIPKKGGTSDDSWDIPANTRMMALFLDDPELNLFPGGLLLQNNWLVQDAGSVEGTVLPQTLGFFSDELALQFTGQQQTTIMSLPAQLRITKTGISTYKLTFIGDSTGTYHVERSMNLQQWSDIGPAVQTSANNFEFVDSNAPSPRAFYRIITK